MLRKEGAPRRELSLTHRAHQYCGELRSVVAPNPMNGLVSRKLQLNFRQLCGSYPASFQIADASGDARYSKSALARAASLACVEMNPTTGTGVQIFRGSTPTISYLSFSGSMSLSISMPISMFPSSSRLEVLMTLFVASGPMPRLAGPSSTWLFAATWSAIPSLLSASQGPSPCGREVGILVTDALGGEKRFLDSRGGGDIRVGSTLWYANSRENAGNQRLAFWINGA
jgi:hypothetical protein